MRGLPILLFALLPLMAGCNLIKLAAFNAGNEPHLYSDEQELRKRADRFAEEAWAEHLSHMQGDAPPEAFECGYIDGYADYLFKGGNGSPPAVPPPHLRRADSYTPDGQLVIEQYYSGFAAGAKDAEASGRRVYFTIPVSSPLPKTDRYQQKATEQQVPTLTEPNNPEPLPPPKEVVPAEKPAAKPMPNMPAAAAARPARTVDLPPLPASVRPPSPIPASPPAPTSSALPTPAVPSLVTVEVQPIPTASRLPLPIPVPPPSLSRSPVTTGAPALSATLVEPQPAANQARPDLSIPIPPPSLSSGPPAAVVQPTPSAPAGRMVQEKPSSSVGQPALPSSAPSSDRPIIDPLPIADVEPAPRSPETPLIQQAPSPGETDLLRPAKPTPAAAPTRVATQPLPPSQATPPAADRPQPPLPREFSLPILGGAGAR